MTSILDIKTFDDLAAMINKEFGLTGKTLEVFTIMAAQAKAIAAKKMTIAAGETEGLDTYQAAIDHYQERLDGIKKSLDIPTE